MSERAGIADSFFSTKICVRKISLAAQNFTERLVEEKKAHQPIHPPWYRYQTITCNWNPLYWSYLTIVASYTFKKNIVRTNRRPADLLVGRDREPAQWNFALIELINGP